MDDKLNQFLDGLARYGTLLPADEDLALEVVVLRGHLLLEEELKALVSAKLAKPEAFDREDVRFRSLLNLAEALYGAQLADWRWRVIRELNRVRNSVAHRLDDPGFLAGIDGILKAFEANDPSYNNVSGGRIQKLNYCISSIHVELLRVRTQ